MNETFSKIIKSKERYLGKCNRKLEERIADVSEGLRMLQNVFSMLKHGTCMCLNESWSGQVEC